MLLTQGFAEGKLVIEKNKGKRPKEVSQRESLFHF